MAEDEGMTAGDEGGGMLHRVERHGRGRAVDEIVRAERADYQGGV